MTDLVVTVPKERWNAWLAEGALAGEPCPPDTEYYYFFHLGAVPEVYPGDRVYVVAHNRLRGYAPLVRTERIDHFTAAFVRRGKAVACTLREPIRGFRGWRYRWWSRSSEVPFPGWREP